LRATETEISAGSGRTLRFIILRHVLADRHVLLQCSVYVAAAGYTSSSSDAGILESIDCRGGSIADNVAFSAIVQRVFTKTMSSTE